MKRKHLVFAIIFLLFPSFLQASVDEGAKNKPSQEQKEKLLNTRLPFIKNNGQLNEQVKYYADTFAGRVFVTEKDITYSLRKAEGFNKTQEDENIIPSKFKGQEAETKQKLSTIKETLIGANLKPEGNIKSKASVNYLKGNSPEKWKTNIPTYDEISLGEVYKDIELKLKAYGSNIEKIFEVRNNAEVGDIKIDIQGAKGLNVNKHGELEIETELGIVKMTKPIAYQEIHGKRVDVEAEYVIAMGETPSPVIARSASNEAIPAFEIASPTQSSLGYPARNDTTIDSRQFAYGFQVGDYNKEIPLIIDPLLASTFLGGSGEDYANSIAIDSSGNVFTAGITYSPDFPTTPGAYDTTHNGGQNDVFISKFNNDLTQLLASTFLGGSGEWYRGGDWSSSIAIDQSGNVYVTGTTWSPDFPTTTGAYDTTHYAAWAGYSTRYGSDVFVSKLSNDLTQLLASTFIGEGGDEDAYSLAIDSSGNVFVAGIAHTADYPTTPGAYDTTYNVSDDIFISKLNSDLSQLLASTFLGSSGQDGWSGMVGMALDSLGNVYIVGNTPSPDFPTTPGAYDTAYNGGIDVFVSKLNSDLTQLLASTFLDGSRLDAYSNSISIDKSGNVYVSGTTMSPDFPVTSGAYDRYGDTCDGFVSKFDSNLTTLLASTFIGGIYRCAADKIAIDQSGNVYVAGATSAFDFPTTPGAYDAAYNGGIDVFVSKLNGNLSQLLASTFLGGSWNDYSAAISIDQSGNVFVAGTVQPFWGTRANGWVTTIPGQQDFPTTLDAYDITFDGIVDSFISKLDSNLSGGYALTVTRLGTGIGTVSSNPAGITCGTDCSEAYAFGTAVTLTATPDSGSVFTGWSGVCSGTGTCTVTMDANKSVAAVFDLQPLPSTPSQSQGQGSGTNNQGTSNAPGLQTAPGLQNAPGLQKK